MEGQRKELGAFDVAVYIPFLCSLVPTTSEALQKQF